MCCFLMDFIEEYTSSLFVLLPWWWIRLSPAYLYPPPRPFQCIFIIVTAIRTPNLMSVFCVHIPNENGYLCNNFNRKMTSC
jgi:hypothetical protein